MIRVIIVDDHTLLRNGLRDLIEKEDTIRLIAEADNGADGLKKIKEYKPDVAVIDIEFQKGIDGLALTECIKRELPNTELVIYTGSNKEGYFNEAMQNDVSGYVFKDENPDELINAIIKVNKGESGLSRKAKEYFFTIYEKRRKFLKENEEVKKFTKRELEVTKLVAECKTTKEISEKLNIDEKTVSTHKLNICNKLSLKGKNALLIWALKNKHLL
jgi:DNA-binding NarL/FixJ family response regulator